MNKKAWPADWPEPAPASTSKEELPRVRKARAEVAAYADCTESQMMAMFGWTDPKMPAHNAQANREKLGSSGMKIVAVDQSQSLDDFLQLSEGGRIWRNFNELPGSFKEQGAFRLSKYFSREGALRSSRN